MLVLRQRLAQRLNRWHRQVVVDAKAFDTLDDEGRHRLRKRIKRLRDTPVLLLTGFDAPIEGVMYLDRPIKEAELLQTMLELNPAVPLSSFGRVDKRYVLLGALAADARVDDIANDVAVLSDNALDALEALSEFLN